MVNRESGQFHSAVQQILMRLRRENAGFRRISSVASLPVIPPIDEDEDERPEDRFRITRDSCEMVRATVGKECDDE